MNQMNGRIIFFLSFPMESTHGRSKEILEREKSDDDDDVQSQYNFKTHF